ncbi:MAG TPA: hypothetical protein VNK96_06690 [Fimbriimonadales bacterium]|nr:hypothetical protein [Fimbriimonadales bacterium]
MITSLLLLVTSSFVYQIPENPVEYAVKIILDGYLPILGGIENKIKVDLGLEIRPNEAKEDKLQVQYSLKSFDLALKDGESDNFVSMKLPFEDVKEYFPDSKVTYTKQGKILATTAPDANMPVQLPGLHSQHLPDITFLLLQFPEKEIIENEKWTYTRKFGDSDVRYEVVYKGKEEKGERFDVELSQSYETLEDLNNNPVSAREKAEYLVKTTVKGSGVVYFSGLSGVISYAEIRAEANSSVESLKGASEKPRKLITTFVLEKKTRKMF